MVSRRLERRLHAVGAVTYLEYMNFLDAHPEEYPKLADDLTIKVSSFFRSLYSFQQVATGWYCPSCCHVGKRGVSGE